MLSDDCALPWFELYRAPVLTADAVLRLSSGSDAILLATLYSERT